MSDINKIYIVGRVGQAPKLHRYDDGGFATVTVATNERYRKKNGEQREDTTWHNVVIRGSLKRLDAIEKYITVGCRLYVDGMMKSRKYEKDGEQRTAFELLCGPYDDWQVMSYPKDSAAEDVNGTPDPDDDIPF